MEEMLRKFKEEFKNVYYMLLDASDAVDALDNKDDDTCFDVWCRYKRKAGQAHELCKVAKILGYTQEDIESWKDEVYNERGKYNI